MFHSPIETKTNTFARSRASDSLTYSVLSRVAVYVVLLAWIVLGLYIYAVVQEGVFGTSIFPFFLSTEYGGIKFRALILFAPLTLTIIGYLIEERAKLIRREFEAENELRSLFDQIIVAFANALDAKSPWTMGHSERVTSYALAIAEHMGINRQEREMLKIASLLHDIGKIGTYDSILDKAAPLTAEEWRLIKAHPRKGADILAPIGHLQPVIPIIRHHHERVDGTGYPDMLKGDQIPLLARILCIADSFDAMVAERPYKPALKREDAIEEIRKKTGTQFDASVVKAFMEVVA